MLQQPRPEGATMITNPKISRRSFIVGSAAVGGGLALGLRLPPFGPAVVRAADGSPEITVWVVIRPDNTTAIRAVRAEMGQGTITGLAQLIAEELECDWSKVVIEYPTPGESVARKRAWGEFSTGGSRGIRQSNEYVRKGGAAARMMLVQAAANEGEGPTSESTGGHSGLTHKALGRETPYGKVSGAGMREILKAGLDAEQAFVGNQAGGDVKAALAGAAKKIEAVYAFPFQNHACMEPMNATARYTPEKCELWGPTQNGEGAFAQVLEASGLAADNVDVHNVMLGGGFGWRGTYPYDYVRQAVLFAH